MGCSNSKVDDLPAVALCRERLTFLDDAIRQRYALAEAHCAYIHSLKLIGHSLYLFIEQDLTATGSPESPEPNLKTHKKGEPVVLREDSGHLNFNSGSDSEDDDSGSHHHHLSGDASPLHHLEYMDTDTNRNMGQNEELGSFQFPNLYPGGGLGGGGFTHMNYMKNKATPPSVVYEQRPASPETVYMGESSSSGYSGYPYPYYGNSNPGISPSPYSSYDGAAPSKSNYGNYGGGGGGYYANSPNQAAETSSQKQTPPPPSPPRSSAWDFFNPFESYDGYYAAFTPSRDSKELRDEEGIPDLEDEDEVVKEVHGDQKFIADGGKSGGGGGGGSHSKAVVDDSQASASLYESRPSAAQESDGMEYEVHMVEKKVVGNEERGEESRAGFKGSRSVFQVAKEIEVQFERASESGNEIAKILEVGRLPYNRKHGVYQVSSMMLNVVSPSMSLVSSQPSTSKGAESSSADKAAQLDMDEDVAGLRSRTLSSTLQKLYLWEKKLYNEVKAEEKMRVAHDRKVDKLKRLDQRGADFQKVDTTRTLIRSLSTKIGMAIQVVDKISVTINKIRDEELWPQLNELIIGLTRMWKCMLECHRIQFQAIGEAKGLGPIGSGKKPSDAHVRATSELARELIGWTDRFLSWVRAQKGYVTALNNWLLKCLLYEPEETVDGVAPFSPSRVGAPPVFVICNQWSQALERISEKQVVDSMRSFTKSVCQILEQNKLEMHQKMMANKDLEGKVKEMDREDQKLQKQARALDKKLGLVSGDGESLTVGQIVYQSDTRNRSLQSGLQHIFEAMEKFTADSMKAYEELLERNEEEKKRVLQERERVS